MEITGVGLAQLDDQLERYIDEVIQLTYCAGGSTSRVGDVAAGHGVDGWHFPKYPSKTVILSAGADLRSALRAFIRDNAAPLAEPESWLGTWYNRDERQIHLDITTSREDLKDARRLAIALGLQEGRVIIALFHPRRNEMVYLAQEP